MQTTVKPQAVARNKAKLSKGNGSLRRVRDKDHRFDGIATKTAIVISSHPSSSSSPAGGESEGWKDERRGGGGGGGGGHGGDVPFSSSNCRVEVSSSFAHRGSRRPITSSSSSSSSSYSSNGDRTPASNEEDFESSRERSRSKRSESSGEEEGELESSDASANASDDAFEDLYDRAKRKRDSERERGTLVRRATGSVRVRNADAPSGTRSKTKKEEEDPPSSETASHPASRASSFDMLSAQLRCLEEDRKIRKHLTENCAFPFADEITRDDLLKYAGKAFTIEGSIGVGKSTLMKGIEKTLEYFEIPVAVFEEPFDPKLLDLFLNDGPGSQREYAFAFQCSNCVKRVEVYKQGMKKADEGFAVFYDRSLVGDMAFELMQHLKGNISVKGHEYYMGFLKDQSRLLRKPDGCWMLSVSRAVEKKRIEKRGRPGEKEAYDDDYLDSVDKAYAACFHPDVSNIYVKTIDYNMSDADIVEMSLKDCPVDVLRRGAMKVARFLKENF